jgi:polyhydroxyalkanoate synthesis regulator phasin
MLKELLYTGIGAVSVLKEKVTEEVKKLEEKGKINTQDVKSFLDSIEEKGRVEDEKIKQKIKESLKEIIDELRLATKEDIEALRKDISSKS